MAEGEASVVDPMPALAQMQSLQAQCTAWAARAEAVTTPNRPSGEKQTEADLRALLAEGRTLPLALKVRRHENLTPPGKPKPNPKTTAGGGQNPAARPQGTNTAHNDRKDRDKTRDETRDWKEHKGGKRLRPAPPCALEHVNNR